MQCLTMGKIQAPVKSLNEAGERKSEMTASLSFSEILYGARLSIASQSGSSNPGERLALSPTSFILT